MVQKKFNYAFGPILKFKSQNNIQIFKSLKMVSFFIETSHVCPCR